MSKVILVLTFAAVAGFPAGTSVDHLSATLTGGSGDALTASAPADATSIEFADVPAGDYSGSVSGRDSSNNTLGTPVNFSFTVTPVDTSISLNLPSAVDVQQS